MRHAHWYFGSITCAALLAATAQMAGAQQLFKCKDDKGQVTFSDRGCQISAKEAAKRPVPTVQSMSEKSNGGIEKLTPVNVEELIQKANATVASSDYKAQCALLAPDLLFSISDASTTPPLSMAGGRGKLCNYMQQSADLARTAGIRATSTLEKVAVNIQEDGKVATAKYATVQKMSAKGMPTITIRCVQDDQLGLYNGNILFNRSTATCSPAQ